MVTSYGHCLAQARVPTLRIKDPAYQEKMANIDAALARWGIETTIVVPGAFTKGTNHFAHAGQPADAARAATKP